MASPPVLCGRRSSPTLLRGSPLQLHTPTVVLVVLVSRVLVLVLVVLVLAALVLAGLVFAGVILIGLVLAGLVFIGLVLVGLVLAGLVLAGLILVVAPKVMDSKLFDLLLELLSTTLAQDLEYRVHHRLYAAFPTEAAIAEVLRAVTLKITDGLFEMLSSAAPPTVEQLKAITPFQNQRSWGVYLLVLEHADESNPTKVYIGSSTSLRIGLRGRLCHWENQPARFARDALYHGYEIVHKGVIAEIPTPEPADVPHHRALMMLLEATLTYALWAMYPRRNDYHVPHLRRWADNLFEYEGLCSHSALEEGTYLDGIEIAPEELERMAAQRKEHNKNYRHEDGYVVRRILVKRKYQAYLQLEEEEGTLPPEKVRVLQRRIEDSHNRIRETTLATKEELTVMLKELRQERQKFYESRRLELAPDDPKLETLQKRRAENNAKQECEFCGKPICAGNMYKHKRDVHSFVPEPVVSKTKESHL